MPLDALTDPAPETPVDADVEPDTRPKLMPREDLAELAAQLLEAAGPEPKPGVVYGIHADKLWKLLEHVDIIESNLMAVDGDFCHVCGCTQNNACDSGCGWAEENLCTECAP